RAPGHPFPHLADRRLSLAVVLRDKPEGPVHYACVELPASLPRFAALERGVLPLEAVVLAHLPILFPGREVLAAYTFRVTRSGDIQLDELGAASFAQAVAEEVRRRPWGPVVRIEVDRAMPPALRELLQRELRFEESDLQSALGASDVYEADGPVGLGSLFELAAAPALAGLDYPAFTPLDPFGGVPTLCEWLVQCGVLVHHPYEA